jgi:hypothetical protein
MSWEGALRLALYMARPPHRPSSCNVVLTRERGRPRNGGGGAECSAAQPFGVKCSLWPSGK